MHEWMRRGPQGIIAARDGGAYLHPNVLRECSALLIQALFTASDGLGKHTQILNIVTFVMRYSVYSVEWFLTGTGYLEHSER